MTPLIARLAPGDGSVSTRTDFFVLEDGPPRPHTVECLSCGGVSASDAAYCPHCGYAGSAMDANESPRLPPPPRPYAQPPPLSVTKDVITDGKRYVVQRVPSQVSYEPPSVDAPSRTPVTAPRWPSPARAVSSSASYSHVSSSESGPRMATASPWMPRAPSSDEPRRLKLVRVKHVKLSQADSRASSHSVHTPAPVQFFY